MNSDSMSTILIISLSILFILLVILFGALFFVNRREKNGTNLNKNNGKDKIRKETDDGKGSNVDVAKSYNKQSIFKFMNFDKIEDNMIIQNSGKRILMIVECQGINYDLMSGVEKNSVEQGFLQFLNTLRYKIQIYIQTRTVNLTSSINTYQNRVENIHSELIQKQSEYEQKLRSGEYSKKELEKERYEVVRLRNLYEYGIDIVRNTERMSLNKNILSKYYYIIIPYYPDELGNNDYDKSEIENIAFSELYTKAQTIINSLAVCDVKGKILDSMELAELLYTAYNRDEADAFSLQRALGAGYEELYSTAPDVLDKRMAELDKKIEREAVEKANDAIFETLQDNEKLAEVQRKEEALDELIDKMAMDLISENSRSIGEEVAQQAINKIEERAKSKEEKEENKNVKKTKTTRKRTTKSA